jgi:8-oxo-dGTP diphosphatase
MGERPKVGVGVFVLKNGKFLIGKRKNAHGGGSWCLPGGHLEFGESWEACAVREVLEETGVRIKNIKFASVTNDIFDAEGKHYITIFILSDYDGGDVEIKEPEKCEEWRWVSWESLPEPLFIPMQNLIRNGFNLLGFIES